MLVIHAVNNNDEIITYDYNPETSSITLTDSYSTAVEYAPQWVFDAEGSTVPPPITTNDKIYEIRLSFGLECNLRCSYCHQGKRQAKITPLPIDTLVSQLHKLIQNRGGKTVQLQFWGGEPLLHFEKIKEIAEKLKDKFDPEVQKVVFSFITNGTLLTQDIVDYCIDNKWQVAISHDGPGHKLRSEDPFDSKLDLIKQLFESDIPLGFNAVITKDSIPHYGIIEYIQNKLQTDKQVDIGEGAVIAISDKAGLDSVPFRHNLLEYTQLLFDEILQKDLLKHFPGYSRIVSSFCESVIRGQVDTNIKPFSMDACCGIGSPHKIALDLAGNVLSCHSITSDDVVLYGSKSGTSHVVGSWQDVIDSKPLDYPKTINDNAADCVNCPVVNLCRKGCPLEPTHIWETNCKIRFAHYMALFQVAFLLLTSCHIIGIEGDFKFANVDKLSV